MSTDRVVIDASVAIAFLIDEQHTAQVRATLTAWSESPKTLMVPAHFWIEVVNSLVRRHAQPTADVVEDLVNLDALGLQTIEIDRPHLLLTIDEMARFELSAYDAAYLALARSTSAALATLDARLAAAAGNLGFLLSSDDPHRLAEEAATYRSPESTEPAWAHSAVVGAEIARLKRELAAR